MLLLACLKRVLSREDHSTLTGVSSHKLDVVLKMFYSFIDAPFDRLKSFFSCWINVPFSNEDYHLEEDFGLKDMIDQILSKMTNDRIDESNDYEDIAAMINHIHIPDNDYSNCLRASLQKIIKH